MAVNRDSVQLTDEELLVAFANTGHVGPDQLADVAGLRAWAATVGLTSPAAPAHRESPALVGTVRQAVRDVLLAHNGVALDPDLRALEAVPLRVDLSGDRGVRGTDGSTTTAVVLGAVAAAVVRASARPSWSRMKACPGPGCAFVFRDSTRNGSRRWCQMSECGNRAKGAAFRARAGRRG